MPKISSQVFISYNHEDIRFVNKLVNKLQKIGVRCFQDEKGITWGQEIRKEVHNALELSIAVLVVISSSSIKSQWVPYEIGRASAKDKVILPLLTDPRMELPDYIAGIKYIRSVSQVLDFFESHAWYDLSVKKMIVQLHEYGDSPATSNKSPIIFWGPRVLEERFLRFGDRVLGYYGAVEVDIEREKGKPPDRKIEMDLGAGVAILRYQVDDILSEPIYFGIDSEAKKMLLNLMTGEKSVSFLEFALLEFKYPGPLGERGFTYKVLELVYAVYKDIQEIRYWITDSVYYAFCHLLSKTADVWGYDTYKTIDEPPQNLLKDLIEVNEFHKRNPDFLKEIRAKSQIVNKVR
jgi:hypothetical protein